MNNLIGKKVIITKCLHHHGFEIGEVVEIRNFTDNRYYKAVSKNGRAFLLTDEEFEPIEDTPIELPTTISRRDLFAAAALQALMTIPDVSSNGLAKTAVYWADELIKELDK